jgi:alanine racemase
MTTMYRPTVAEIDLAAIRDNLQAIRAFTPLKTQVIGVVKADAYGHGAARVAAVLEQEQVRLLAVATSDEAADPVTLIGEQDGLSITVDELAELMGTISYEVLTGISKRVPRIYLDRRT